VNPLRDLMLEWIGEPPAGDGARPAVPFVDLRRAVLEVADDLAAAIGGVLASGMYTMGERTRTFEEAFAAAWGVRHAVGVATGTDALELAVRALGLGPGDEVVTQANTSVATVAAIERAGATPVLCDVNPLSGRMDPESLAAAVGPRTSAVIPVHLYGQPADMAAIGALAERRGLVIIEDCAQAHGAAFEGRQVGTMGAAGCFSFYPTKNLGALGDAGAVITDDRRWRSGCGR
jgi:dTDP-3-amino-3,4,6-trideoxy-alpha-D-glucose transaminase